MGETMIWLSRNTDVGNFHQWRGREKRKAAFGDTNAWGGGIGKGCHTNLGGLSRANESGHRSGKGGRGK